MKKILFLIVFTNLIYADSLMIVKNNTKVNWCITDSYYFQGNKIHFYSAYQPTIKSTLDKKNVVEIKSGYKYNSITNICELHTSNPNLIPDENGLIMGMEEKDFHFSIAIWGIMLASLISFGFIKAF